MLSREKSAALFATAEKLFPGGVNSPVRAFKSVGGTPLFAKRGKGAYLWDEDGHQFVDFCCSWGPLILGHSHPAIIEHIEEALQNGTSFGAPTQLENELASLIIDNIPFVEKIRFVSSGTEAVMSGIRLARAYTGKTKIIKFEGCYHGHCDSLLVKSGSGLATFGTSSSAGVPASFSRETIVLPLNDEAVVEEVIEKYREEIACIIIEPVPANNGLLIQRSSFLSFLRSMCSRNNILLFFDEVISGFRVAFAGAAAYHDVQPDIVAYGKILGGGLPVGAYGGSSAIMSCVSPLGDVYQAGTLSGNPVAMAAGIAQLKHCLQPNFYEDQEERTRLLVDQVNDHALERMYLFEMVTTASIFWPNFSRRRLVRAVEDIPEGVTPLFRKLHSILLEKGIYLGPSGYEVGFISQAHTPEILNACVPLFCDALDELFSESRF